MKEILKNLKLGQIIGIYHFEDSCFTVGKILTISSKKSPTSISRGWIAFLFSWNCFKNMI